MDEQQQKKKPKKTTLRALGAPMGSVSICKACRDLQEEWNGGNVRYIINVIIINNYIL